MKQQNQISFPSYIVDRKITSMAKQIVRPCDMTQKFCFIGIMKGGLWTLYRLVAQLALWGYEDITIGHIGFSSYNAMLHASEMRCTYPLDLLPENMEGRKIWLIDDIYDTGATVAAALEKINKVKPESSSLQVATLVTKHSNKPEVSGFLIDKDQFVVGCGMGLGEKNRSQSFITSIQEGL